MHRPAAVRVMGDWFAGEGTRSLFMGLWCGCNNVGNLTGAAIGALSAAALGPEVWGAPLLVLAVLLLLVSWFVFLRLTPRPELVGRRAYRWSVGAKEELAESLRGNVEDEDEEEDEGEEHIIAFGPASPMVRLEDEWEGEERRRPLLEVAADDSREPPSPSSLSPPPAGPTMSMWRALWLPGVLEVSISYAALKGSFVSGSGGQG
jgi:MFS family permease